MTTESNEPVVTKTWAEKIEEVAPGLTFQAILTRDDYKPRTVEGRMGQSHFSVSFSRNGYTFTTEYHQGSAHRQYADFYGRRSNKPFNPNYRNMSIDTAIQLERSKPRIPEIQDVLACLVVDAGCVDYNDFEDFCSEFDYSDDSISAKESYDACCRVGKALKKLGLRLEQLQELFQDF